MRASKQFRDGRFHNPTRGVPVERGNTWALTREFFFGGKRRMPQGPIPVHSPLEDWARRAEDPRLQGALYLRLADTLDRLGDPAAAQLHRGAAERMLGEEPEDRDAAESEPRQEAIEPEPDPNACEIRSASKED